MPERRILTPKQARFVAEYLVDLNATQAAIRAGYSLKTAEQQAYQLLQKPSVAETIAAGKAKQLARADLSAARVLEEYRRVGFSDIGAVFDRGRLRQLTELSPAVRTAIASIKVTKRNLTASDDQMEVIEVKLWDKIRALEGLGKHFGLLVDRVKVEDDRTLRERISRARQRLEAAAMKRRGERES